MMSLIETFSIFNIFMGNLLPAGESALKDALTIVGRMVTCGRHVNGDYKQYCHKKIDQILHQLGCNRIANAIVSLSRDANLERLRIMVKTSSAEFVKVFADLERKAIGDTEVYVIQSAKNIATRHTEDKDNEDFNYEGSVQKMATILAFTGTEYARRLETNTMEARDLRLAVDSYMWRITDLIGIACYTSIAHRAHVDDLFGAIKRISAV